MSTNVPHKTSWWHVLMGCFSAGALVVLLLCAGLGTFIYMTLAKRSLPNGYYVSYISSECAVICSDDTFVMVDEHVYDWRESGPFVWGYRKPAYLDERGMPVDDFFLLDTSTAEVELFEERGRFEAVSRRQGLDENTVDGLVD